VARDDVCDAVRRDSSLIIQFPVDIVNGSYARG
jgi:hypothetical protein